MTYAKILKYNPCHDEAGRFCATGSGAELADDIYTYLSDYVQSTLQDKGVGYGMVPSRKRLYAGFQERMGAYLAEAEKDPSLYKDDAELAREVLTPTVATMFEDTLQGQKYKGVGPKGFSMAWAKRAKSPEFMRTLQDLAESKKRKV